MSSLSAVLPRARVRRRRRKRPSGLTLWFFGWFLFCVAASVWDVLKYVGDPTTFYMVILAAQVGLGWLHGSAAWISWKRDQRD